MRRAVYALVAALLTVVVVGGWLVVRRDRAYRELVARGDAALDTGDAAVAIEAFSGAIALRPESMLAWLRRGEAYLARHEEEPALRDLRQAAQLDPASPRTQERLGDALYDLGRFTRAAEQYEASLALDDRSASVALKLASARFREGRLDAASRASSVALQLDPALARAHYLEGLCALQAGTPEAAVAPLRRAIDLTPNLLEAREALALASRRLDRRNDELRQLEALVVLDGDRPERAAALARAYGRHDRLDLAVATLGRALDRAEGHPLLLRTLGALWVEAGEARHDRVAFEKAIEALEAALARESTADGLYLLGRAYLGTNRPRAAERVLERAVATVPVPDGAFELLGETVAATGDIGRALAAYQRAEALVGDDDPRRRQRLIERIVDLAMAGEEWLLAAEYGERALASATTDRARLERLLGRLRAHGFHERARSLAALLQRAG